MKSTPFGAAGHSEQSGNLQSTQTANIAADNHVFIYAVLQGLTDIEQGKTVSLVEAKERIGLW